jgi:hypothetical protein
MSVTINGTNGLVFNDNSTQTTAATGFGFKNRIINGDMRIDQRNAGASITFNDGVFPIDRWTTVATQSSKGTIQQNAGAVTPPAGFTNYLGFTSSSAYSVGSGDAFAIQQRIEGLNLSDLGWGSANAQTVTLSFWVRSSLTGTFGGSISNSAQNRSYPFTYTISAANTWELETVTIAGDTSGTWLTTNGIGARVNLGLGAGSTYSGTAGAWSGSTLFSATGATSVVGTNGATFYITGVQLEKGSTATSFDYRPYGTELSLCQRYYLRNKAEQNGTSTFMVGVINSATLGTRCSMAFPVAMRTAPTMAQSGCRIYDGVSAATAISSISAQYSSTTIGCVDATCSGGGFTAGRAALMIETNSSSYVDFSAEL